MLVVVEQAPLKPAAHGAGPVDLPEVSLCGFLFTLFRPVLRLNRRQSPSFAVVRVLACGFFIVSVPWSLQNPPFSHP